ncbi:hypothetical protein M9Y10_012075 [Tritrichomonas musculus]|uniref:Uncharacterized protein n=1 Tax=Tritrichomonas musculus TaxID=1915356 RepID=A0ABR2IBM5_9EUKA
MKNIEEHFDPDTPFKFLVFTLNYEHLKAFSCLNSYFKKKKCSISDYLFNGVYRFEIPQHIKYFKSIENFSFETKMGMAGLCRSIIVLYGKYPKFMDLIDANEIPQYIINQHLKDFQDIMSGYIDDEKFYDIVKNDVIKLSIFMSSSISWKDLISLIRNKYPNGMYHKFTFVESMFLLYLHPHKPNFIEKHHKNYKEDVSLYVDCLSASIQFFMRKLSNIDIYKDDINNYESLSQRIFSNFLDFYEEQLKLDDNLNYFNQIKFDDDHDIL